MAEEKELDEKKSAKKDPIVDATTAPWFLISSGLLALTVVWGIVDEVWIRRPYKRYQADFVDLARRKVENDLKNARAELEQQKGTDAYRAASERLAEAQRAVAAREDERKRLNERLLELTGDLNRVREQFQIARGDYQPLVYNLDQAEHEGDAAEAAELRKQIAEIEPRIKEIFQRMEKLSAERQAVQGALAEMDEPVKASARALAAEVPAQAKINDAETKLGALKAQSIEIVQVYNPALNVVDRCESCHIATQKPGYSKEDWTTAKGVLTDEEIRRAQLVYATHPHFKSEDPAKRDILEKHPVAKFGCTSCHGGNGPATTSAMDAHGLEEKGEIREKHGANVAHADEAPASGGGFSASRISWDKAIEFQLTPILGVRSRKFGNMMEANCGKCHVSEVELPGAPQLSLGRQLIEDVGCWGCHKITGFEVKENELQALKDTLEKTLEPRRRALAEKIARLAEEGEEALPERQQVAKVKHEIRIARDRIDELEKEIKFIGPDLNRGLQAKVYPAWLPRWIYDPQHFRAGTWMPNALLTEEQAIEAAAYVWQQDDLRAGPPPAAAEPPRPDPAVVAEGKRLVQTKGCIGCHTLESPETPPMPAEMRGPAPTRFSIYEMVAWWANPAKGIPAATRPPLLRRGATFGPSLEKVGEKIRYEWLVKWILDPKAIQPHTRMPRLRLTTEEAQAMALYLTTLRRGPPGGETFAAFDVARLADKATAKRGYAHVIRYGCYNCHTMNLVDVETGKPLVNPGKIGAELSSHGSKPLAQFDFGFFHHDVPHYRPAWLLTKILEPRIWDTGKYKGDPADRLRMPRFGLTAEEAAAITTVLVGLTDTKVPAEYVYQPRGRAAALVEGERLLKKFNCRSCHVIDGRGQYAKEELLASLSEALKIPRDDPALETYLPPLLNGQGHRTNPDWLFRFLKDPGSVNPFQPYESFSLRPWHVIKMPTFDMSDAEARALVEYFVALENEDFPYAAPPRVEPTAEVLARGRQLFVENACASCHQIGEFVPAGKKPIEMGPNFALARERLREDWLWRFIPDPQAFIPGTNMPAPAPWGAKPYALQPEAKQKDLQALAAYLLKLGDAGFREREGWVKGGTGPK